MRSGAKCFGTAWWTVCVLAATMFAGFLDRHMLVLLITPIKQSMRLSDTQVGLLIGVIFTSFYLLAGIPLARWIDRGNRKRLLAGGALLWGAATAGLALAPGFGGMAAARVAQGVGSSLNAPASISMTGDLFPPDRLARPIAAINVGGALGSALALLCGGLLLGWLSGVAYVSLPLVGEVEPWRVVLLLAALPGPLLALLILATVPEPARRPRPAGAPRFREVARHLARHRAVYLPIMLATGLNSSLLLGLLVWTPSLFERRFGWATGEPGLYLGGIMLVIAPLGLVAGGWLADRRAATGDAAANVRVVVWACAGLAPLTILYPLMPTAGAALAVLALGLFCAMIALGPASAAVQRITPDRMRGTVTAIYVTAVNMLGYGAGPLLVALLTDRLFAAESRLAASMALLAAILGPLALAINALALRPYGKAVRSLASRSRT